MKVRLFKTKKLALEYIKENYHPQVSKGGYTLRSTTIDEDSDIDERDMPNLQFSGECDALAVEDGNLDTVDIAAWWEDGDSKYELFVGEKLIGEFDNSYDARLAYNDAVETEEYKDEDEEEIFEVKLVCDGEVISD